MKYLLDTNIIIFHLRGNIDLNKIRQEKNCTFLVSEISILELFYVCQKSANPKKSFLAVKEILSGIKILRISNCAEKYAEVKNILFGVGKPLHNEFDLLIGVTALVNDLPLVTDNFKDFANIPGLKTENWIER